MIAHDAAVVLGGDCLDVLPTLDADSMDAIVCDPPYGLAFMGREWDHGVPGAEFWRDMLRVAKPGAHLVAFGGTRTYHRLACAIEDAGWEIRDGLMWLYGSGFPKSHDVSKALDKAAGVAFDAARQWKGWGTALKPAWEPIILARKPLVGTVASNVTAHGTGVLNIDGCRIGTEQTVTHHTRKAPNTGAGWHPVSTGEKTVNAGRWPANVAMDEDAAALLDAQSGPRGASGRASGPTLAGHSERGAMAGHFNGTDKPPAFYGDSGGASRFFYCAKASRRERGEGNTHPTVKPLALMRWLCRLVTPPGGLILDPFTGSGSTGAAAVAEGFRFVGIEREEEYVAIANARIAHARGVPR